MAFAPYQITPDQAHRERKKAALLRALAGVAARGGGADFLSSFQTGLGGALGYGQIQNEDARRNEELNLRRMAMQQDMERAAESRVDPTTERQLAIQGFLGRNLTPAETARLWNFNEPQQTSPAREYGARPFYEDPAFIAANPELAARYRNDAFYHAPPAGTVPSQQEREDAATAAQLGISPGEATALREQGGFQTFQPFSVSQSVNNMTGKSYPDTTWHTPSGPQASVQTLRDISAAQDPHILQALAQSDPDPIVRQAAARRLHAIGGVPPPTMLQSAPDRYGQ